MILSTRVKGNGSLLVCITPHAIILIILTNSVVVVNITIYFSSSYDYIVYLCLYRTFTISIYSRPTVCSPVATTSGLQSSMAAGRVEPISNVIKGLGVVSCDSCEGKLASFDVYVDSSIANVPFLKRYCSDCIQNITC
jgi:hypothetical protein